MSKEPPFIETTAPDGQDPIARLRAWNEMNVAAAQAAILPCNGSVAWAARLVALRPFGIAEELFAASDAAWESLRPEDWQQAFDSHPRIGEAKAVADATAQSLHWSHGEQAAANPDEAARAALRSGNQAYEEKFGRVFIIYATGKSAAEMLSTLEKRMDNDAATELRIAAEEQCRITQLRLRKWLGIEPVLPTDLGEEVRSA